MQKALFFLLYGAFFLNGCKSDKNAFVDENPIVISVTAIPAPKDGVDCELLRKQFIIPKGTAFNCDSLNKIVQTHGISF